MKKTGWIKKSAALLFALLGASICRADSTTSRLNLVLPTIGSPIWGQKINGDMQIIDAQVAVTTTSNTFVGPSTFNNAVSIVRPNLNSSVLIDGAIPFLQLKNGSGLIDEIGVESPTNTGGGRYPGPANSLNMVSATTDPIVFSVNDKEQGRFSETGLSASTITVTNNLTLGSVSPGNCLETDGSGKLIDAGFPCGSGGGGVSTINTLTNGATNFIWNTQTLQSGSPSFDVSSGTVAGFLYAQKMSGYNGQPITVGGVGSSASGMSFSDTSGNAIHNISAATNAVEFNQDNALGGNKRDFKVNGKTGDNLLYVNAHTDTVGIGTSTPNIKLHVNGGEIVESSITVNAGYFGSSLSACGDATHALSWSAGSFGCQSITGSAGGISTINTLTNGATNFMWNTSSLQSGSPSFFVSSGTVAGQFKANTEILSGNGPSITPLVITGDAGLGQTADLQQWNSAPGFRTAKIGPFGEGSFGSDYLWSGPTSTEKLSVYGQGVVARFGYEATPTSTIDLAFVYNNAATFNKISFRPFTSGSLSAPAFDFDDASGSSKFSINVNDLDWGAYVLSTGTFRFYDADNSNYAAFQASHTITSDVTWVLPSADGSNGQVLTTNGAGNLSWTTASGGSGSPGGSTGQLQYNNGGSFGGIAGSTVSTSGTIIAIQPQHAADIPISIMAAPSQSGYLFKTTDSAGNILDVIDSAGDLTLNKYLNGVSTLYMSSSFISGYGGVWIGHDNTTATGANYAFLGNASTTLFNGAPDVEFRGNNLTGLILHNDGAVTRSVFGYAPTSASGDSIADVSIIPFNGLYKGLVVKADAAQSVNLQEWQNSSGVALSSVTASGVISGPYRLIGHTIAWFHANAPLSSSKGEEYYCEDCTVTSVAISTGATTGSWAIPSSKTTFPN